MIRVQKQAALTKEMTEQGLELGNPAFIRVFKSENLVETWVQNKATGRMRPFKTYPICNYSGTLGPKIAEGDRQAPEGFYEISASQMNPWSQYHLSFNIGFPNGYDRAHRRTGSNLMIHGNCKSEGCYALTDPAIEEIYLLTEASIAGGHNVPVHIFPFRMTPRNMARHTDSKWLPFWQNLKEGYDAFELTQIPPEISLKMTHTGAHYAVKMPGNQKVATAF
jgi:murein L,D-transpeptidase YafK